MSVSQLPERLVEGQCLNCGADLDGAFCAACGQRSIPANPTVSELAGDAWQELSGYDGRFAATFRNLLRPGRLTIDYLEGRRARYLPPVRLYLIASVTYFLIAAAAPETSNIRIGVTRTGTNQSEVLSPQEREEMLGDLDETPWFVRPIVRGFAEEPEAFQARVFTIMPRVFFAMLPVFAAILALLYRRRRFPVSLVFAAHIHAAAYLIFAVSAAARWLIDVPIVAGIVGLFVLVGFGVYALMALRAVFGGGWPITIVKATSAAFLYVLASVPAFIIILIWASVV